MTQIYDAHLTPVGLTLTQYSLLSNLRRQKTLPTVHELAEIMGMDRTTVTRNLKPLMERGLLAFSPGADRRSKCVSLTLAGQKTWELAKPLWQEAQAEIQARLGDIETATLHRLLDEAFGRISS